MNEKEKYSIIATSQEKYSSINNTTIRHNVEKYQDEGIAKLLVLDNDEKVLKVLAQQDVIILDTFGQGNLDFLTLSDYVLDGDIMSLSEDSYDFVVTIYFNKGNVCVYKGSVFSEIINTNLPIIEPINVSSFSAALYTWGRFIFINKDFWILSPFPILGEQDNTDTLKQIGEINPLMYFSDRSEPFGEKEISASFGSSSVFTYFPLTFSFDRDGSEDPIPPENQPVRMSTELFNIGNRLRLYDILEGNNQSGGINSARYNNVAITSVSGNKTSVRSVINTTTITDQCNPTSTLEDVSIHYEYSLNITFNIYYGNTEELKGFIEGNTYKNEGSTAKSMFVEHRDLTGVFDGVSCQPVSKHRYWEHYGHIDFGSYEYGFNMNIPQDIYGNVVNCKNFTKSSRSFESLPMPYRPYTQDVYEYPQPPNIQRYNTKNTWGLNLPRNISYLTQIGWQSGTECLPILQPIIGQSETPQHDKTILSQSLFLDKSNPITNYQVEDKYYYYTKIPKTIKQVLGNMKYGNSCLDNDATICSGNGFPQNCELSSIDEYPAFSNNDGVVEFSFTNGPQPVDTGIIYGTNVSIKADNVSIKKDGDNLTFYEKRGVNENEINTEIIINDDLDNAVIDTEDSYSELEDHQIISFSYYP
jgi:hypothetical protein